MRRLYALMGFGMYRAEWKAWLVVEALANSPFDFHFAVLGVRSGR